MVEGGFSFNPEFFSGSWDPKANWHLSDMKEHFFGFAFIPRSPIIVGPPKQNLVTEDVKALATEENYVFRVEWQTSGDNLEFHFLLNGKPLIASNGATVSMSVPQSKIEGTALGFRLTSGSEEAPCFTGFLGRIQAEAQAP
jgi:hypothetical protein